MDVARYLQSRLSDQPDSNTKYEGLSEALRQAIEAGVLQPGSRLPGERALAEQLGLSRITVRNAIDKLVEEGQLVRRQGARTLVAQRMGKHISNLMGFSEDMKARGLQPGMQVLHVEQRAATAVEQEKLALPADAEVIRLHRLRFANEQPIALEIAVLPVAIVKSADAIGSSLYASLDAMGHMPREGVQKISAEKIAGDMASILNMQAGDPVLVVRRCCSTVNEVPVEYTTTYYNASIFEFVTELQR